MTISDEISWHTRTANWDAGGPGGGESAMREDPQIEARVLRIGRCAERCSRLIRQNSRKTFRSVCWRRQRRREHTEQGGDLEDARAATGTQGVARAAAPTHSGERRGRLPPVLIAGVGLGFFMWGHTESPLMRNAGGALVARGQLAQALSNQLPPNNHGIPPCRLGVSFRAKSGDYCAPLPIGCSVAVRPRMPAGRRVAGFRPDSGALARPATPAIGPPGSALSGTILKSVEGPIAGEPLDQAGERGGASTRWAAADR